MQYNYGKESQAEIYVPEMQKDLLQLQDTQGTQQKTPEPGAFGRNKIARKGPCPGQNQDRIRIQRQK